jgi:PleD family two-component response regulator
MAILKLAPACKDYIWGGEEFILFMPGTDLDSAEKILEKMY